MGCIVTGSRGFFLPSGMTKNGSQSINSTSYTDVTGWTADTATYPGSTVDSNLAIVVQGGKSDATLTANVPFSGGSGTGGSRGVQVQILKWNGSTWDVVVEGAAVLDANSGTATASIEGQTVSDGDLFKVQVKKYNTYLGDPSVSSGSSTYLRVT